MKSLMWLAYWFLSRQKRVPGHRALDSQKQTPVVWAGGLEVRGKRPAETNCRLPPFFPGVSPEGLNLSPTLLFRKKGFLKGGSRELWVARWP